MAPPDEPLDQPLRAPAPYGYGQPAPYGWRPVPPKHPHATTAMVLGIVGLAGSVFLVGLSLVLSPVAWVMGGRAVKQIDAEPGRWSGRDEANTGRITGIIGTVLLILGVLLVVGLVSLFLSVSTFDQAPAPLPSLDGVRA